MKKFFVMFAIAGALVACNDSGSSAETTVDSTKYNDSVKHVQDSIAAAAATPATTATPDSLTKSPDSLTKAGDTSKMKK